MDVIRLVASNDQPAPIKLHETEPCTCSHGLGRHPPITPRPCSLCACQQYTKAGNGRGGRR